MMAG
jgi:hypothetical protein